MVPTVGEHQDEAVAERGDVDVMALLRKEKSMVYEPIAETPVV